MRAGAAAFAAIAVAAIFSPDELRCALAATASALFEATPFVAAGIAATHLVRTRFDLTAYLGCGCVAGPSARSLPATAATWLVFGPVVALARFAAAHIAARLFAARLGQHGCPCEPGLLGELRAVFAPAVLAGALFQILGHTDPARFATRDAIALGAALGFAAPCGLGSVALGGVLRNTAPGAAAALLCTAGILDLRAWTRRSGQRAEHDAFGYGLLAAGLAMVAWHRGATLVHPALSVPLWLCAVACASGAVVHRRERCGRARIAPALMLVAAIAGAPPPPYRATETTLTDLFAGEQLHFTGRLTHNANESALVRYAITCCRADAAPIVIRLAQRPHYAAGTWLAVDGRVQIDTSGARLVATTVTAIAPPSDPFVYR